MVVQKQRSLGEGGLGGGSASAAVANKVRRGDIRHAIVVRTAKKLQRKDGMVVRFDDNACVLINKAGEPIGTRVNGMPLHFHYQDRLQCLNQKLGAGAIGGIIILTDI